MDITGGYWTRLGQWVPYTALDVPEPGARGAEWSGIVPGSVRYGAWLRGGGMPHSLLLCGDVYGRTAVGSTVRRRYGR